MGASDTRRSRSEARREVRARLARLHVLVAVLAVAGLSLPRALATPGRSDETAMLVCVLWALVWLRPAGQAGERSGPGSPPLRLRLRRALRAAAYLAFGLGLYWSSLRLPPAARVRLTTRLDAEPRASVAVTDPDNPFFLARVVRVNNDLSLVVDEGASLGFLGSPGPAGGAGPGETVCLTGVDGSAITSEAAEAAIRLITGEVLGRLVTVWVQGASSDGTVRSAPVQALVYAGVVDVEAVASRRSLNSEIETLLVRRGTDDVAPGGEPDPAAPGSGPDPVAPGDGDP